MQRIKLPLFCIITTALLFGCGKSPESTVEIFYRSVEKGEITVAKKYVSAQIVGMLGDAKLTAALAGESEKIKGCGGIRSITHKLERNGEIASGMTTIDFEGNCKARVEKTKLVKEDGMWKLGSSK